VPITGTVKQPGWAGKGKVIEYAVKMVQFPQQAQLDRMLGLGELNAFHLDAFARLIADFHQGIKHTDGATEYGDLKHVIRPVKENFSHLREQITDKTLCNLLDSLQNWCDKSITRLQPVFEQRKQAGFIRECHGDMHLRNMAWINNRPVLFDCIEFNPNLRWIDVISDIAFLVMDLHKGKQYRLAQGLLNNYLEYTGDYSGVSLLPFYLVYRALVRAKVEAIRAGQSDIEPEEQAEAEQALHEYLLLADSYTHKHQLRLMVTHGFSACGKTTISRQLSERLGAVRIRSDVERKRLFGLQAQENGQAAINQDIYSTQAGQKTYDQLAELAEQVLAGGFSVFIDAACLKLEQRDRLQTLADANNIAYVILDITASKNTLRQRIEQRSQNSTKDASDADLTVLEHQFISAQKLTQKEEPYTIGIDTEKPLELDKVIQKIEAF